MNIIILSLFFAGVYLANAGIVSYVKDIPCGQGTCPDGNTCCYGDPKPCCPTPNGVCCGNGHCCPSGYSCSGTMCVREEATTKPVLPIVNKKKQLMRPSLSDISCDGCNDGDTCCPGGCCPGLSDAVCCGDGTSCCPSGYICAPPLCIRPEEAPSKQVLKMLSTSFAKKEKLHNVTDIPCDGGTCPDGDTCCSGDTAPCCPTPNGVCCGDNMCCSTGHTCCPTTDNHGCCPYINAVCCNNDRCCPNGYRCNGDGCLPNSNEESGVLPQMEKLRPSTKTVKSKN